MVVLLTAAVQPAAVQPAAAAAAAAGPYACGTFGDGAAIGWAGNDEAVVACLGGSFRVVNTGETLGYGIYDNSKTTWTNAEGYLPAMVTSFHRAGADISITNFGDRVTIGGNDFVAIYSRVHVTNSTSTSITIDPQASQGLVPLNSTPVTVAGQSSVNHDYAVLSDRFGNSYPYPSDSLLARAGGYDQHYAHMRGFWKDQLKGIAQIRRLPDQTLIEAYKTGFIYTQIIRSGTHLKTGVNGYDEEFSHDVIGILANMLTQGYTTDGTTSALDLLLRARDVVGATIQSSYHDGLWKYSWPWAIYLQKTGDLASVKANFATPGPAGSATQPSIKDTAHAIAAARTGPGGIMNMTDDIDSRGYWTIDNYSALMGLTTYRWLAQQVGDASELQWANDQYTSLLSAVNQQLNTTISTYNLNYLPCSMVEENNSNRCTWAEDANWAAPFLFGRWAWDGYLFGAAINGPGYDLIDATYNYGFGRLVGLLPPNTFGGYRDRAYDSFSTSYNAGYGEWGLASAQHRDQGILSYQFMIANGQSGPYSWWENQGFPNPDSPWVGTHPAIGGGSSPHAWGIATANLVLLDSLVAERSDGSLIVGRGVPNAWVRTGQVIDLANVPTMNNQHVRLMITFTSSEEVTLTFTGPQRPAGPVLFQLPAFVDNLAKATAGTIDQTSGTVTLLPTAHTVTVTLKHAVN